MKKLKIDGKFYMPVKEIFFGMLIEFEIEENYTWMGRKFKLIEKF